jgi:hypothetical protein
MWIIALIILSYSAIVRLVFFKGTIGTDELIYISQGYNILNGDFGRSTYIGSLRYGSNAAQALSLWLFGNGAAGADGLYFASSLGQVLLVHWFAGRLWGRTAAIWAGLAMAALPIDAALAGGLNPDCFLGLTISASLVIFYFAERQNSSRLYLLSGLLAGFVFLIKEVVIVYGVIFVVIVATEWRWRKKYLFFVGGGVFCLFVSLFLFWYIYGDPFYQFKNTAARLGLYAGGLEGDTSLGTYFVWLFVKIYHVGLLGWLAAAGALLALRRRQPDMRFVLCWAMGLLVIFSAFPFSLDPLKFIPKQTNYMEIFLAPLALLAGWFLAQQRKRIALPLAGMMILSGFVLSAFEQQVVKVASVNGVAAAKFAEAHRNTPVFGPASAQRQSYLLRLLRGSLDNSHDIRPAGELPKLPVQSGPGDEIIGYIIQERQVANLRPLYLSGELPAPAWDCLVDAGSLEPQDLGFGRLVVAALRGGAAVLPPFLSVPIIGATDSVWQIAPARVLAVTRACAQQNGSGSSAL